jgi:hypothetical protein
VKTHAMPDSQMSITHGARGFTRAFRIAAALTISLAPLASLTGCAAPSRTSTYDSAALLSSAESVREAFASSTFLSGRTPSSPEIRLLVDKLENFSSERLTRTDQLATVWRVVSDDGVLDLLRQRNVRVYFAPRDDDALARVVGANYRNWSSPDKPTHILNARFNSITRGSSLSGSLTDQRADDFLLNFNIIEDASGAQLWSHTARFKRSSFGTQVD